MTRNVLLVSDVDAALPGADAGHVCWRHVAWSDFSSRLLRSPLDLLVLVASAARVRNAEFLTRRTTGRHYQILAVLPPESPREDIEFVLSFADDLALSSEPDHLFQFRVRRLLESCGSEADVVYEGLIAELGRANLVGADPTFLKAAGRIAASARTDLPVLITGETGTGKELFARAIHFASARRNRPFMPMDCGAIPDHLFENELFGHVRGAYTDAKGDQRGLAASADGGTLFLDEVDSLPIGAQAKLLRFLQERQYRALGSEKWLQADVRIVAASNRNLTQQIADKQFRQDLYFRLDVLRVEVPPLRDRPQDIPLLARHFLSLYGPAGVRRSFSPAALRHLTSYHWPGNVRELLNVIQRAIVFSETPQINVWDVAISQAESPRADRNFRAAREESIEAFERDFVQELMLRHQGNVTRAAREAGKERRAFGRLVKKYGLRAKACAVGAS